MDWVAWNGLAWLYDKVEEQFGTAVAWIVAISMAVAIVTIVLGIAFAALSSA